MTHEQAQRDYQRAYRQGQQAHARGESMPTREHALLNAGVRDGFIDASRGVDRFSYVVREG